MLGGTILQFVLSTEPSYCFWETQLLPIYFWLHKENVERQMNKSLFPSHWNEFKEFAYLLDSSTFLMSQDAFTYSYLKTQYDCLQFLTGVCMICHCTECYFNWGTEWLFRVKDKCGIRHCIVTYSPELFYSTLLQLTDLVQAIFLHVKKRKLKKEDGLPKVIDRSLMGSKIWIFWTEIQCCCHTHFF